MENTVKIGDVLENMKDIYCTTIHPFDKPVTFVQVRMKNGFTINETATCVDPANYDEKIGRDICLKKIEDKIWMLLGYALQDKLASEKKCPSSCSHLKEGQCNYYGTDWRECPIS